MPTVNRTPARFVSCSPCLLHDILHGCFSSLMWLGLNSDVRHDGVKYYGTWKRSQAECFRLKRFGMGRESVCGIMDIEDNVVLLYLLLVLFYNTRERQHTTLKIRSSHRHSLRQMGHVWWSCPAIHFSMQCK